MGELGLLSNGVNPVRYNKMLNLNKNNRKSCLITKRLLCYFVWVICKNDKSQSRLSGQINYNDQ